jgi:hypothetical protein
MSVKRKLSVSVLACAILAAIAGMAMTFSAFTATTKNDGNQFKSGSVVLTDNDVDTQLFSMADMQPGTTQSKCLKVTYSGSLDSLVKLYATTTSSTPAKNLAPYLDVTVTRGSFSGAEPAGMACDGFTPAAQGAQIYSGTLASFPSAYATGAADATTFHKDDTAVYQVTVSLQDNDAAQAKDATTNLTFEARDKGPAAS